MKKVLLWVMVAAAIVTLTAGMLYAAVSNPNAEGVTPIRTIDETHLGTYAIVQEFVWDSSSGTFQTVNLYTAGKIEDYIADRDTVLAGGASGNGSLVGTASGYVYWDGTAWATKTNMNGNITRYEGEDERQEGVVSRYDNTYYTYSTTYWTDTTGWQTLYSTWVVTSVVRHDPYYYTYYYTYSAATGSVAQIGTFSSITQVPASYEPVVEITLANGWTIQITSDYSQYGNEIAITSPTGQTSYIYGDPHLLQANGTQQQELAAVGNYVFDLGDGYTLDASCLKSNAGFSLLTDLSITGPNDYEVTYGRNGEVKVSGGTE